MLTRPKQSNNATQAVISTDQNFILAKNIGNFTDIVSPFKKVKEVYSSKFVLPINQLHRIQTLYDSISSISQYTVIDNNIKFDCVSNLPRNVFGDATDGYIHFSAVKQHKKDNKIEVIVDPKMVFQLIECEPEVIIFDQRIRFKSDFLKAFPVILRPGFIFSTADKTECKLFISIVNPKEMLIGECSKYEIINVIQYILPLWPIFDIYIGKTIQIKLQFEFIQDKFSDIETPILLFASYNLENPKEITIGKIAEHVNFN